MRGFVRVFQPGRRPGRSAGVAACAAAGIVFGMSPVSAAAEDVDLIGTWFVLIHYKDSMTANPDADRWEDKVWRIEKKGSRLQWTEYPIVVFNDGSGRFGRVGRNPRARLLRKWEPNDAQAAEIREGVQVNSRGSKTKSLRGSPKRGFKSSTASRSVSAMTVGYQETWSIDAPTTRPVFTRDDALGTEASLATQSDDVVSGRTRYATLEVRDGGNVLEGSYARDENKKGTFRLIRGGAARGIESDGRTPNQKRQEREREQFRAVMRDQSYSQFLQTLGDDTVRDLREQIGEEKLSEIWGRYEQRIIGGDKAAEQELGDALREAYAKSAEEEFAQALASGGAKAFFEARKGQNPERDAFLGRVRDTLGEDKIAQLRKRYGDRVEAGDEKAIAALKQEVRQAYEASMREDFKKRLEEGDPEAIRQYREMQRKERDRR